MPITPVFTISQNIDFITIEMKCPYIKATEVTIDFNKEDFRFYCKPYFLRLHFNACLIEDGREKSSYDPNTGIVKLILPKETRGEEFLDLDLLTKLMDVRPVKSNPNPLIETLSSEATPLTELDSTDPADPTDPSDPSNRDDNDLDWNFNQQIPAEIDLQNSSRYGFNNSYQGYGSSITELAQDLIDIHDIDASTSESRRQDRMAVEEARFDADYYMWDYAMNKDIKGLLEYRPEAWKALKRVQVAMMEKVEAGTYISSMSLDVNADIVIDRTAANSHIITEIAIPLTGTEIIIDNPQTSMESATGISTDSTIQTSHTVTELTTDPQTNTENTAQNNTETTTEPQNTAQNNTDTNAPNSTEGKAETRDGLDPYLIFTEKEQETMRHLPNKDFLIDPGMMDQIVYLGLVDILFAYCYNARITEGEDTVESAWTVCRLSGTLSALDSFTNIEDVVVCFLRRGLTFPLYRSFELCEMVRRDVVVLLKLGKRAILKALLVVKALVAFHESMYLMERVYVSDYCVWIQKAEPRKVAGLASLVKHVRFERGMVTFADLVELERVAREKAAEEVDFET